MNLKNLEVNINMIIEWIGNKIPLSNFISPLLGLTVVFKSSIELSRYYIPFTILSFCNTFVAFVCGCTGFYNEEMSIWTGFFLTLFFIILKFGCVRLFWTYLPH